MTLAEFLNKWASGDSRTESRLKGHLSGFFGREPRTIRNWMSETPDYVKWILNQVDSKWQESGCIDYKVFFMD